MLIYQYVLASKNVKRCFLMILIFGTHGYSQNKSNSIAESDSTALRYGRLTSIIKEAEFAAALNHTEQLTLRETKVISGIQLEFRFYQDDRYNCVEWDFFLPISVDSLATFNSVEDLFKVVVASCQGNSWLDGSMSAKNSDTINYIVDSKFTDSLLHLIHPKSHSKQGLFYQLSETEFIRVAKVNALLDVFSGNKEAIQRFNPFLVDTKDKAAYMHYRSLYSWDYIQPESLLGIPCDEIIDVGEHCLFRGPVE